MAKMAEDAKHGDYRSRARDEYNNRRAEGRLGMVISFMSFHSSLSLCSNLTSHFLFPRSPCERRVLHVTMSLFIYPLGEPSLNLHGLVFILQVPLNVHVLPWMSRRARRYVTFFSYTDSRRRATPIPRPPPLHHYTYS